MSVKNVKQKWTQIQDKSDFREYILPKRSDEEFWDEGHKEAQVLLPYINEDDTVLDYGCGIGRVAKYIQPHVKEINGIDITPKFRALCNQVGIQSYAPDSPEVLSKRFNFIYSLMVLQHNSDANRLAIMNNIKNMLADGGVAYIQFPMKTSKIYTEGAFVHKFSKEEVAEYGNMFSEFEIHESNLINYAAIDRSLMNVANEYILIAKL